MVQTVRQPSVNPTRKLTAATAVAAIMQIVEEIVAVAAPEFSGVASAITPFAVLLVGYFVTDKPNVEM